MRRSVLLCSLMLALGACGGSDDGDAADLFGVPDAQTTADDPTTDAEALGVDEPVATPEGVDRSAELIGTWNITFYALPDGGGRTNVIDGSAPVQITFNTDGTATYHTGCNAGDATYSTEGVYVVPESALDETPEGQPLTINAGMIEEAGCEGFLGEQNGDLPAAWQQAERFRLDGERLILSAEFFLLEAERG